MKVIFLGTPNFSARCLNAIYNSTHEVVAVVTQPDKINGRNNKIAISPVKEFANKYNIPLYQFANISKEGEEVLKGFGADIMVTSAYGQILRQNILDICPHGILNVHASLLPEYRGSSPVQWAILDGKKELGVTIMKTELSVDTGDMLLSDSIKLYDENTEEALEKLSHIGGELIVKALDLIESGKGTFVKQDESKATHCRMLKKEDGILRFDKPAERVVDFVRGMNPWPGAFFRSENGIIKVVKAKTVQKSGKVGEILEADGKKGLVIACAENAVELLKIKPENGKEMDAKAYLLGKKLTVGSIVGE